MSRFRYVILPRLLLALSALALLAALFLLWLTLGRPLPAISLACRQTASASCFTGGELLASGPIRMEEAEPESDAWAVLHAGDKYAMAELNRTAGLLWSVRDFLVMDASQFSSQDIFSLPTVISYFYYETETPQPLPLPPDLPVRCYEQIPLAICTNPSVVRVEGELLWLGHWEDPQEALAERGVPITWSSAGNGVWVGEPVRADLPAKPDGNGHSGTLSVWCRGYDADGNLVCSYDPTV